MKKRTFVKRERGQVIFLVAGLLAVFGGMTAIAVDLQSLQVREATSPEQRVLLIRGEASLEAWYAARDSGPFALAATGRRFSAIDSAVDGASAAAFASAESGLGKFHKERQGPGSPEPRFGGPDRLQFDDHYHTRSKSPPR